MEGIFGNCKKDASPTVHDLSHSKSAIDVSAKELSYLKTEVWSLQNNLRDEKISIKNLNESFRKLANEKYDLLEEISRQNVLIENIYKELCHEREINNVFLNEIEALQKNLDKNQRVLERTISQNVDLKRTLVDANETIHQMGLMYLKLCEKNP